MRYTFLSVILIFTSALCYGWGQKGHDATAFIAEQHLTETTRQAIDSIFNGYSLVYWSNWLDNASHGDQYRYTSTWHYKNIDADVTYEEAPVNEHGNIITAITAEIDTLNNRALYSPEQTALALKILVHLVGDLHQPMHMGRLSDRGGNEVRVIFFNRDANLHGIWDSQILESGHKWSYTEWQQQLDRLSEECQKEIIAGTYDDWGKETHYIATAIYEQTPQNQNLSYDYVAEWTPVIEQQFVKGGLRLAHLLNQIFDPEYTVEME